MASVHTSMHIQHLCFEKHAYLFFNKHVSVFLLAIYLDITFCVLKFGGKSSLLRLLAIIGFAIVINTFGFIIVLIYIRVCLYYGTMPVDIEQWSVEIGNFSRCSQLSVIKLYLNMCNSINNTFLVLIFTFTLSVCCLKFYVFRYLLKYFLLQ